MTERVLTRREIAGRWLAATTLGLAVPLAWTEAAAQNLPETPACGPEPTVTIAQTEGPFFTPRTPRKRSFRADAPGEPITLIGFVTDLRCRPIADALVDLWHADARGEYDNSGYKLRGHQLTDAQGRYVFETILPGLYPGRTRHFHVKVAVQGQRALTTQLYFPEETRANSADSIFDRRLLMRVQNAADGKVGRYDFVIRTPDSRRA
jgi:protocatechuate 3,4-dioxygenase beta subunit